MLQTVLLLGSQTQCSLFVDMFCIKVGVVVLSPLSCALWSIFVWAEVVCVWVCICGVGCFVLSSLTRSKGNVPDGVKLVGMRVSASLLLRMRSLSVFQHSVTAAVWSLVYVSAMSSFSHRPSICLMFLGTPAW